MKRWLRWLRWIGVLFTISIVNAQNLLQTVVENNNNVLKKTGNDLDTMGKNSIALFLKIAIALGVTFAIWAGIQYVLAAGDEAKAAKATKTLTFVWIGLAVAMAAYFLLQLAQQTAQSL